jgi:hypothetical protein
LIARSIGNTEDLAFLGDHEIAWGFIGIGEDALQVSDFGALQLA